jgi:hypothetical protein
VLVLAVSVVALGAAVSAGQAAGVLAIAAGVLLVRGVGPGAARAGLALAGVAMATAATAIASREHVPAPRLAGAVIVVLGIALIALA